MRKEKRLKMPVWCESASLLLPFYFIFLHFVCPLACTVFPRVIVLKQTNKQSALSFFSPSTPHHRVHITAHITVRQGSWCDSRFRRPGRRKRNSSRIITIIKNPHDNVMESSWSHVNNSHVGRTPSTEDPGHPGCSPRTRSKQYMDQLGAWKHNTTWYLDLTCLVVGAAGNQAIEGGQLWQPVSSPIPVNECAKFQEKRWEHKSSDLTWPDLTCRGHSTHPSRTS